VSESIDTTEGRKEAYLIGAGEFIGAGFTEGMDGGRGTGSWKLEA